jgi:hypothetical protein
VNHGSDRSTTPAATPTRTASPDRRGEADPRPSSCDHGQPHGEGHPERRERVPRSRVEIARVDGEGNERAEGKRRAAGKPGTAGKRVQREERKWDRNEREREVQLHQSPAQPAIDAVARDVVELDRLEHRVDDEHCNRVGGEKCPDDDCLALGRRPHYGRASWSAAAT